MAAYRGVACYDPSVACLLTWSLCCLPVAVLFLQCLGSVTSDPKKMGMIVSKSFGMFDKDKSGFIEAAEAKAAAQQVRVLAARCYSPRLPAAACIRTDSDGSGASGKSNSIPQCKA
jgi:hypothetical protein